MANVIDYIKKYGDKSFDEEDINDIDYVIFASLSYVNLSGIVDDNLKKITISEAGRLFLAEHKKRELKKNIIGVVAGIDILKNIYETKRYGNLYLYNHIYKSSNNEMFSAIFIDLTDKLTCISFEGTDELVSGWLEDTALSYEFPVPSHRDAIDYLNEKIRLFSKRKYILVGHSKGGNSALVGGMYMNPLIRKHVKQIISFDGPGLLKEQYESKKYNKIKNKFKLVVPDYSVVGLMLNHSDDYAVIKASFHGLYAHSVMTWEVSDDKFIQSKLSNYSLNVNNTINRWLDNYDYETRKVFFNNLFDILKRAEINNLLEIKMPTLNRIYKIIKETKKLDDDSKSMIKSFVNFIVETLKEEK